MGVWNEVINVAWYLVKLVLAVLFGEIVLPWVRVQLIPWLREKRLYRIVSIFVQAAEKMAASGQIDKDMKLKYVIDMLNSKNIEITPEVRAFIESAVIDLDRGLNKGLKKLMDEFVNVEVEEEDEEDDLGIDEIVC